MPLVFDLDHRHRLPPHEVRALIGGKAANLATMTVELGLPVPPGFVVSTEACRRYLAAGWPGGLDPELRAHMHSLERVTGRRFGGTSPLVVSVRSGAPVSMPGMLDTILNLGLNEETTAALAEERGDPAFARACRERFVSMFGSVAGAPPPEDPWEQLRAATQAVFGSWNSDRARGYRRVEGISDDLGTAVTIQAMVFGNAGPRSATGVLFTRNPATGERAPFGDVLFGAQGEDVVSGGRGTFPVAVLAERMPEAARRLSRYAQVLEHRFADMCDVEFTIERGRLFLLQVRVGKRTPQAALRLAVEMAEDPEFPLSRAEAVRRVRDYLRHPPTISLGRRRGAEPITKGLPASPGVAVGEVVTSPAAAHAAADGRPLILVRAATSPDDVPAMARVAGVLTSAGGLASHAAVVARGWGIPAVVGAGEVEVDEGGFNVGPTRYRAGQIVSIDGSTGEVFCGPVAVETVVAPAAAVLLGWARELGINLAAGPDGVAAGPGEVAAGPGEVAAGSEGRAGTADGRVAATDRPVRADAGPAPYDDVIRCLSVKGSADDVALAAALLTSAEDLGGVLGEMAEAGTVAAGAGGWRLTAAGSARAAELLESDRRAWGAASAIAALDAFLGLDERVKATVAAWQLREAGGEQVVNDHTDAEYDARVLGELAALHGEVSAWFAAMTGKAHGLSGYLTRLDHAIAQVMAGDHRFVSSPLVDSYHSVWFELHEQLIRLAGRTRAQEQDAGRA